MSNPCTGLSLLRKMNNHEISVRACMTPGRKVKFDPGWLVDKDPCKDQIIEIFDFERKHVVMVTLKKEGPEIHLFQIDESGDYIMDTDKSTQMFYNMEALENEEQIQQLIKEALDEADGI